MVGWYVSVCAPSRATTTTAAGGFIGLFTQIRNPFTLRRVIRVAVVVVLITCACRKVSARTMHKLPEFVTNFSHVWH